MAASPRFALVLAAVAALAATAACDKPRPVTGRTPGCTACHGGELDTSGAPPMDTTGHSSTAEISVGAHAAHLKAAVVCSACHRVPSAARDPEVPEHQDGNADVTFGGTALLGGGAAPAFDRTTGTCSNVYCHGAKLPASAQGRTTTPVWTGLPPSLLPPGTPAGTPTCGACHGTFESAGAPARHRIGLTLSECVACHADSVTADGTPRPASTGGRHLDGAVDVDASVCAGCHGDPSRAEGSSRLKSAPPLDTAGLTSSAAVGAHLRHVSTVAGLGSRLSRPIDCDECHAVPSVIPHPAGAVVRFEGALGTADNLVPTYSGGTCSNVYCHGATLPGGSNKRPSWTQSYASAGPGAGGECGTCHFAANPPAAHPQQDKLGAAITATTQCAQCHAGTVKADGTINLANGLHVNGLADVKPHADGWVAAAVHGLEAKKDLSGCAASACHGADFGKDVGDGKSCNTCHASPADFGLTAPRHASWQSECTFCHGDANRAPAAGQDQVGSPPVNAVRAAPPLGSRDETSTAANAVGAHLRHTAADAPAGNRFSNPLRCAECHGTSLIAGVEHVDGQITIGWQLAASGMVPTPAAGVIPRSGGSATAVTCSNYCHGGKWAANAAYAGATPTPAWTGSIPAVTACGSCHKAPPASPAHAAVSAGTNCGTCHEGYDCTTGNLGACSVYKLDHLNGTLDVKTLACNTCHGSAANDAPPAATSAVNATVKAGAHQAHLAKSNLRAAALACADCHTVPSTPTHASGVVDLAWGTLASTGGLTPSPVSLNATAQAAWEAAPTCTNYCHGSGFPAAVKGSGTAPSWTGAAVATACGSCHQAPPATPAHAAVTATTNCATCHTGYSCTTANLAACTVDKTKHLNGVIDTPALGCNTCHGSAANAAPPSATVTTNSAVKIGAHQAHLVKANLRATALACGDCHTVPSTPVHSSGTVDLAWSALARTGSLTPTPASLNASAQATWEASPTCTNYCHGSGFAAAVKGTGATPSWTGAAVATACGSCHQAPPATADHASVTATTNCGVCHTGYSCTTANLAACTVNKALHLNGAVDAPSMTCSSCHGSATNAAPPAATSTTRSAIKVGAHQAHLVRTTLRATPIACGDCHTVPTSTSHSSGTVDMTWGTLARSGGVTPAPANLNAAAQAAWEASPTCTNYCHGAAWSGTAAIVGSVTSPSWTATGAAIACDACHKAPPWTTAHSAVRPTTNCGSCHSGYSCTTASLATCTVNKSAHLNGTIDTPTLTCASCHGSAANNAPPVATSATNEAVKIGAHQAHLVKTTLRTAAIACGECHAVPSSTNHASSAVEMSWGALAAAGGVTPRPGTLGAATSPTQAAWEATPTCTNYCHGAGFDAAHAGSATSPSWTGTTASTGCASCHKAPPSNTDHASVTGTTNCSTCHTGYSCTTASLAACTVNKASHLNGSLDVSLGCTSCHGSAANAAPPAATSTTNSAVKIGAHQAHLVKANLRTAAIACADCHTVPTSTTHSTGTVDLTWSALARTGGLTPTPASLNAAARTTWEATPTCTNYCHGSGFAAAVKGSGATPSWTGAAVNTACGSCHQAPPATADHSSVTSTTNCGACHTGYSCTTANLAACTVNKTTHLNGAIDAPSMTCSSCHGSATNAAPPVATSTTRSAVKIGAHQAHLVKTNLRTAAIACADCHTVPTSTTHSTGTVDLTWSALARTGGLTPSPASLNAAAQATWEATPTCTNYCHGSGFDAAHAGSATTASWTGAAVATACGSCHKAPPSNSQHASVTSTTNCGTCHTGYSCTTANLAACTVNKVDHMDGALDVTLTCSSCHGSAANAAPPAATVATNSAIKIGAHQAHLVKTNLRTAAIACADCHTVPTSTTHSTGTVDLTWGALARTGGLTPTPANLNATAQATWEATPTCTNYCHGSGFAAAVKGTGATPSWTGAALATACGSCHQAPPATADHSSVTSTTNCGSCHSGYSCTTANLAACTVNKTAHLNGAIDAPSLTCSSCHGSATNAAPPAATSTTRSAIKIGAHQAHLVKTNLRSAAIACADCHTVPTSTTHSTGTVDLTWSALARTGGLTPTPASLNAAAQATWEATPTCTNYCHGSGFVAAVKGTGATPSWTGAAVNTACGSCHQAPPATSDHTSVTSTTNCGSCHSGYSCTTANLAACTVNKTAHLNGLVDPPSLTCSSCHGSATNAAPPAASSTTNSAVKIGAHQAHLVKTNLRTAAIACADCHTVPTSTTHSTGTVDLTWSTLARTGGLTPTPASLNAAAQTTWEATPTCTNYCHGSGFDAAHAGSATTASWTGAAVATACGSCHKAPPSNSQHASVTTTTNCGSCHTGYNCTTANLAACSVNKVDHMDGALDVTLTCSSCHGSAANAAPPAATVATNSAIKIGAHQAHLVKTNLRTAAIACADCHTVPTSTTHSTGTVDLTWGALARTGGLTPTPANLNATAQATWEATPTCTNYCHGSGFAAASKGSGATPSWTGAAVNTACGSCHQAPPATADHTSVTSTTNCGSCHSGYSCTTANLAACTVNKTAHLNGAIDAPSLTCSSCHGSATNAAPPAATSTTRSAIKIGAHQAHLVKTNLRTAAIACADCHTVPTSTTHSTGTVDLTWSALARTGGLTPTPASLNAAARTTWEATPTCTNYCHGSGFAAAVKGSGATPSWTGAAVNTACGSCHQAPPATADHTSVTSTTNCGNCHSGYSCTTANLAACTVNKSIHLDGTVQGSSESAGGAACGGCHATILQGMNGTVTKTSRHLLGGDAAAGTALTWGNPLSSNAAASRTCTNMCHGDHPHDATSPAAATHEANVYSDAGTSASRTGVAGTRVVTGGTGTVNRARTDFEAAATNGGLCVSCHQNPVDATHPAVTKAGFSAGAHNFTTGWQFQLHSGAFDRNCTKCHASTAEGTTPLASASGSATSAVHFGDNASLLAGKTNPAGTAAGFVCYNCHGSTASPAAGAQGNRSGKDIQSQIVHATTTGQSGHPANTDAVHASVAEETGAAFGNTLGGKARHSGCMDCHDSHEAKAGTHVQGTNLAGPPLQGAWGAQLSSSPAAWAAPTSANFTKKTIVAGTDLEATLCFKCHSGFYGTLPTSPSGGYAETDQAKEFNTANVGFHPVLGSDSAKTGNTGNLVTGWTRTSLMTCSDCHESDVATDPSGPHGAASKFILKGPNTKWDATLSSTGSSAWMPAGTFCLNCHNNTSSSSRFTQHSRGDHSIACFNCHAAIPHGGPRPGMLVSPAGAATAVGGTIAGWDTTSPYFRGGGSDRLYIKSYPTSNTAGWSQSNCGCNGTGH